MREISKENLAGFIDISRFIGWERRQRSMMFEG
jgi:hypothetical protein